MDKAVFPSCVYVLGDQRMCMTVDVANKQTQDVHTCGAILFVSADNSGWNEEMGMNDASGSCGDLQSHRKPAADWCFLSLWNFHTVIFPTARLEVWSASLSLMWGDNSKVCWFESHSISTTLRLLQQTWLPEINQTSCYSSELLSPNLMR